MQKQTSPVRNLTRDGILQIEENIKEDVFVQIINFEEIKRQKDKPCSKNKYFK